MRWLLLFQSTLSVRRATIRTLSNGSEVVFQSTLSVRRATRQVDHAAIAHDISIHALRKESDGETDEHSRDGDKFQSTLSVRRATDRPEDQREGHVISIHALRKESDRPRPAARVRPGSHFNPRSP